jgi:hypothetical protein
MYSNMNQDNSVSSYLKGYEKLLTSSILDDKPRRVKLTLDDIPTRGNKSTIILVESGYHEPLRRDSNEKRARRRDSDRDSPKVLNFKEYYDNSRLCDDFEEKEKVKRSKSNFERDTFMFQRGA